jgi:hypothetical protein
LLFGRVSLGVLVPNFLSEEVWGRESSRVRLSNPKFRVFLRKVRCEPPFIIFGVLTVALRSCLPWCPLCRISEEVWGRESSRVRFLSNPKFRVFEVSASLFSLFFGFDFDGCSSVVSPWCPCAEYFV